MKSNTLIRKEFEQYLIKEGYKEFTAKGNPSTVYSYIGAVDFVCEEERFTWAELADNIGRICVDYDWGGVKGDLGMRGHRTIINGLKQYRKFCVYYLDK